MTTSPDTLWILPAIVQILNDNPSGSVVLVCLTALAVVALALLKRG